jgi:hypothetical protein
MGIMRNAYKILVGTLEPRSPLRRWEDNIRMVLGEIGWEGADWMHLAQGVVNMVTNIGVP